MSKTTTKTVPDPIAFLSECGILDHINRMILHPIGLHAETGVSPTTREVVIARIIDNRANPIRVFSPKQLEDAKAKMEAFLREEGRETMKKRKKALGYITQE